MFIFCYDENIQIHLFLIFSVSQLSMLTKYVIEHQKEMINHNVALAESEWRAVFTMS